MKRKMPFMAATAVLAFAPGAIAAGTPCEEVKSAIEAKISGKGVKDFSLTVQPRGEALAEGRVVGQCEAGSKQIVYRRGGAAMAAKPEETVKP